MLYDDERFPARTDRDVGLAGVRARNLLPGECPDRPEPGDGGGEGPEVRSRVEVGECEPDSARAGGDAHVPLEPWDVRQRDRREAGTAVRAQREAKLRVERVARGEEGQEAVAEAVTGEVGPDFAVGHANGI